MTLRPYKTCMTFFAMLLLCLSFTGCNKHYIAPEKGETAYSREARKKLERALSLRNAGNSKQAIELLGEIRSKYPFSKYAIMADFEVAESYRLSGDFQTAVEYFELFIKLHPGR